MLTSGVVLACAVVGGSNGVVMVMLFSASLLLLLLIVLSMIAEAAVISAISMVTDSVSCFVEAVERSSNSAVIGPPIVFELVDSILKILILNVVYCFSFNKNTVMYIIFIKESDISILYVM